MHQGRLLKEIRNKKGISQAWLGGQVGLDGSQISRYEDKSELPKDLLESISETLDSPELRWEALGSPIKFTRLNNIDDNLGTIKEVTVEKELPEMLKSIGKLVIMGFFSKLNPSHYSDKDRKVAYGIAKEVVDVIVFLLHFLVSLKHRTGISLKKVEEDHELNMKAQNLRSYENRKNSPAATSEFNSSVI